MSDVSCLDTSSAKDRRMNSHTWLSSASGSRSAVSGPSLAMSTLATAWSDCCFWNKPDCFTSSCTLGARLCCICNAMRCAVKKEPNDPVHPVHGAGRLHQPGAGSMSQIRQTPAMWQVSLPRSTDVNIDLPMSEQD
jgi:hypothetical protein